MMQSKIQLYSLESKRTLTMLMLPPRFVMETWLNLLRILALLNRYLRISTEIKEGYSQRETGPS